MAVYLLYLLCKNKKRGLTMNKYKSTKEDFISYFEKMTYDKAFSMNNTCDFLIENSVFNYHDYFVEFFKYMDEHCSDKNTEYDNASYLRNKINYFGNKFKVNYYNAFNLTEKKVLKNYNDVERNEKAEKMKNKFSGNLFEIIHGLYSIEFPIIEGFEFDTWCNNTEDDFRGVDGLLKHSCDEKIKIPMNSKHSNWNEISKYEPFQKLGDWIHKYAFDNLTDEETIAIKHLKYRGIIFTDNDTNYWTSEKFNDIYVVNDEKLCKMLGKAGEDIGNVSIWKHWYNLVK